MERATTDIELPASDAARLDRLELARACIEAAHQLMRIAAALVRCAERDAQRDLAVQVNRWLASLSERAKALGK